MVFFANTYVGHCTRLELTKATGEAVGRYKGHAVESSESTRDVFLNLHMDDLRPATGQYWLNHLANSYASLTEPDALLEESATIAIVEPITLIGSTTAVTLSMAAPSNVVVYKRDFSVQYVTATDYTRDSSELTRLTSGNISSGQEVLVSYNAPMASCIQLPIGGGAGKLRGRIVVTMIEGSTGYPVQYIHEDASPVGDWSFTVEHAADWAGIDVQYRIFARLDQARPYGELVWGVSAVEAVGN